MKIVSSPSGDSSEEILALVRQLHETQQRLRDLTGGEVDAVIHPEGQSYLLQEAQEKLRQSEMAQRHSADMIAGILNALPAHIALLDLQGVIISVNDSWERFATANGLYGPDSNVGQNYVEICELATGECSEDAHLAAAGIRGILNGGSREFTLEYPCHSPTEKRWYQLMVTPVGNGSLTGAAVMHINITARKLADEAWERQRTELQVLFDLIPAMIWFKDTRNGILRVNQRAAEATGKPVDFIEGKPMREIYPAEADAYFADDLEVITSGVPKLGIVERLRSLEGTEYWIQTDKVPVRDPDGKVRGIIVMAQDITERRRIESRFRLLVDSNAQGVMFWNTKGEISGANDAFLNLVDYTREDLQAGRLNWMTLTPSDYADVDRVALGQMAAKGVCIPFEKEFFRKDGSRVPILLGAATFADKPEEGVCFVLDLTERKRSEEVNIEQAALLDKTRDAIMVRDLSGKVLYWNRGAEQMYGWARQQAIGRRSADFLYAHPEKFDEINDLTIDQGEWSGEVQHLNAAGDQLTVEARWTLIRDKEGRPKSVLAINTNITERKKIEHQFLRAQRMESIGTLAGGIAHDLNNILAPILMSIQVLKVMATDGETIAILNTIETSAKRGADVVRQVLSFARGVEGQRIEVQPKYLLEEIENIIRETFPKNIRLEFLIPEATWTIEGDPTQIHQILLNLCVNARDAMINGGNLSISVENCVLDEHYSVMNLAAKAGRYVMIDVTDSGTGMPPGIIDKIFEPFFTTKDLSEGTGLGLSTVMAIVKSHQGIINVYSEVGRGTTFKVYLPAVGTSSEASGRPAGKNVLPRGDGKTVLVIEDEESILTITSKTLQTFGYKVLTASDGAEGLGIYAQHQNEISVVLTDMTMPIMNGMATIRALLRINPRIKIVATSGLNANEDGKKLSDMGVKYSLVKPYTAETLLTILDRALAGAWIPEVRRLQVRQPNIESN